MSYSHSLIIGTLSYNPSSEIASSNKKDTEYFSFEIALMKKICERIQVHCHFVVVPYQKMSEYIARGKINLAIGSIIITPERRERFLFSLPYKVSHLQYIVLANSKINTIQSLLGKTIGIYLNSPSRNYLLHQFHNDIQLVTLPTSMNMLEALRTKKVNAILTNYPQAKYWIEHSKNYKLLGSKFNIGEGYGIMAKKGNDALVSLINEALLDIESNGTYLKLYQGLY